MAKYQWRFGGGFFKDIDPKTAMLHEHKKPRNKIKRSPVEVRQSIRGLAEAINLAILRGERYLEAVPVSAVRAVLQELFDRTDVKGNVLLDPEFSTLFK